MSLDRKRVLQVATFAAVGAAAALIYVLAAWLLVAALGLPASLGSVLAYGASVVVSYSLQKTLTFKSALAHRVEVPRFALSTAIGLVPTICLPILLVDHLHLPVAVAIMAVCLTVPVLSFVLLDRFVFAGRQRAAAR